VKELVLQYIWQYKLFSPEAMKTTNGENVTVIDTGKPNTDAGPDFFNAKIKIGETLWAGNVEIHTKSSDWEKHKHFENKSYDNTILHVVKIADKEIFNSKGEKIPQLELIYPSYIDQNYENLLNGKQWIPCASKINLVPAIIISSWKTTLVTERLQQKTSDIQQHLAANNNNFEEVFYVTLAKSFGFGTNSQTFGMLAQSLPLNILAKHKNNLFQIEALLFGQAGLLSGCDNDEYCQKLAKEYSFLQSKYQLKAIDGSQWKLLRMRPVNFPHVRIAQFASLIYKSSKLFSKIVDQPDLKNIQVLFQTETSEYWETHYKFGDGTLNKSKKIGKSSVYSLIINTVIPFLFAYASSRNNQGLMDRAFSLLSEIPSEKNSIIEGWKNIGITAENAVDTQALIQLKKNYCDDKKCLRCSIGLKVLII